MINDRLNTTVTSIVHKLIAINLLEHESSSRALRRGLLAVLSGDDVEVTRYNT